MINSGTQSPRYHPWCEVITFVVILSLNSYKSIYIVTEKRFIDAVHFLSLLYSESLLNNNAAKVFFLIKYLGRVRLIYLTDKARLWHFD